MAIALGWLAYVMASWFLVWNPVDAGAYLDAAERLRDGHPLYQAASPEAHEVYRYAPWFAYFWVPLVDLPRDVVAHVWSLTMLACGVYACAPLFRHGSPAGITLGALCLAFLAETAMFGNAHPLVVALLVFGLRRDSAPVWVGVAASLKLVPILFVLPWLLRGEWRRPLAAIATTALLCSHMLLFDLGGYVATPGSGLLSVYAVSPALWVVLTGATFVATLLVGRGRSDRAWAGVAALSYIGPPRVVLSYLAFAAPAVIAGWRDAASTRVSAPVDAPAREGTASAPAVPTSR
jgi:hypothetical protein